MENVFPIKIFLNKQNNYNSTDKLIFYAIRICQGFEI